MHTRAWLAGIATYLIVHIAWVFFRANSLADAGAIFGRMFYVSGWTELDTFLAPPAELIGPGAYGLLASLVLFIGIESLIGKQDLSVWLGKLPRPGRWAVYYGWVAWILAFGAFEAPKAFIYFQF